MCVSLYQQKGLSLREIGRVLGMDHKSIATRLRRKGVKIEKRFARGDQRPNSKLNDALVVEIKKKILQGFSNNQLAREYSVSSSVISEIRNGKAWKHIK